MQVEVDQPGKRWLMGVACFVWCPSRSGSSLPTDPDLFQGAAVGGGPSLLMNVRRSCGRWNGSVSATEGTHVVEWAPEPDGQFYQWGRHRRSTNTPGTVISTFQVGT